MKPQPPRGGKTPIGNGSRATVHRLGGAAPAPTPGSFVLTGSGFEGSECEGWFGLDVFADDGEGLAWEAAIEDSQEPVADQG